MSLCDQRLQFYTLYLSYGKFLRYVDIVELATSLPLEDKVEIAHRIVEEALRVSRTLFKTPIVSVGFSGGKSSLVVLDIVLHHVPRDELYVVYCNTFIEYPENRTYVIRVVKEYFHVKKLVEVIPRITPWFIWRTFGFPRESRDRYYTPVCCVLLKELPVRVFVETYGVNLDFTGIQAMEAHHRLRSIADYGLIRRTASIGREVRLKRAIVRAMPIGIWLDSDVWAYIEKRGLPVNPVYEKYGVDRQGCLACTNTSRWRDHVERYSKSLYEFIKVKIVEWGVQKDRIRYTAITKTLQEVLRENVKTLYTIREHFY